MEAVDSNEVNPGGNWLCRCLDPLDADADDNCSSAMGISQSQSSSSSRPDTVITAGVSTLAGKTEVSSFSQHGSSFSAGTVGDDSLDSCSLDSIGRMLLLLEDNDASLNELFIDCKSMDKEGAAEVALYLHKNTRVKKLKLYCGKRSSHRHILCKVMEGLKGNSSVESFEIEGAVVNRETASWLTPSFVHSKILTSITMTSCKGSGLEELCVAMQQNKYVRKLSFVSCYWDNYIADIVASSLR